MTKITFPTLGEQLARPVPDKNLVFDAPGSISGKLQVSLRIHSCGGEDDGVAVYPDRGAGFVIAFADLERWYLGAKKFRKEHAK